MKSTHVVALVMSCITLGVVLTLLIQHKPSNKKSKIEDLSGKTTSILNPNMFSGNGPSIPPSLQVGSSAQQSSAPPGAGRRWTPIK